MHFTRIRRKATVTAALAALLLAFASPAVAQTQTPSDDAYGGLAAEQQAGVLPTDGDGGGSGSPSSGNDGADGTLPFTGLELGLALIMGVALLGTGIVVRRVSRATV